jgi:acid phosphatase class B
MIILVHVDDLFITGNDNAKIDQIQKNLAQNFKMTNLREAKVYLGAEFEYFQTRIYLHQRLYIRKIVKKYELSNCNSAKLPMDSKIQ